MARTHIRDNSVSFQKKGKFITHMLPKDMFDKYPIIHESSLDELYVSKINHVSDPKYFDNIKAMVPFILKDLKSDNLSEEDFSGMANQLKEYSNMILSGSVPKTDQGILNIIKDNPSKFISDLVDSINKIKKIISEIEAYNKEYPPAHGISGSEYISVNDYHLYLSSDNDYSKSINDIAIKLYGSGEKNETLIENLSNFKTYLENKEMHLGVDDPIPDISPADLDEEISQKDNIVLQSSEVISENKDDSDSHLSQKDKLTSINNSLPKKQILFPKLFFSESFEPKKNPINISQGIIFSPGKNRKVLIENVKKMRSLMNNQSYFINKNPIRSSNLMVPLDRENVSVVDSLDKEIVFIPVSDPSITNNVKKQNHLPKNNDPQQNIKEGNE